MVKAGPPGMPRSRVIERGTYRDRPLARNRGSEAVEEKKKLDNPRWKMEARSFLFDILAAFIVLLLLVGGLYTFTDNWPPLVVVQSGSMQHSQDTSFVGVIDTGDLVFVKRVDDAGDVTPYLEGREISHRTYDSYGDVIIFRPNGNKERTAIIHRAVMYVEFNDTDLDWENRSYGGFDVPLTGETNLKGNYRIEGYEWPRTIKDSELIIDLNGILESFYTYKTTPHGGFITKGDDNPGVDQTSQFYSTDPPWIEPVQEDWVIGKSVGELPWFGIIKLYLEGNENWPENSMRNLIIAIVVLVSAPFILDVGIHLALRTFRKEKEDADEEEEISTRRAPRDLQRGLRPDPRRYPRQRIGPPGRRP